MSYKQKIETKELLSHLNQNQWSDQKIDQNHLGESELKELIEEKRKGDRKYKRYKDMKAKISRWEKQPK